MFNIQDLDVNPFRVFDQWYTQALRIQTPNPNAFTLTSVNTHGKPSSRIVLLKQWDEQGFVFYTNYTSRKGQEIAKNTHVALLFYWDILFRQIRIEGTAEKTSKKQSTDYFNSRPLANRIGAWASKQSQRMQSRQELEKRTAHYNEKFSTTEPNIPDFWGGYRVIPQRIEFWHGENARLHQRRVYTRSNTQSQWESALLYP